MNNERIAKKLVELRGDRKREEVAKDLGISVSAISMYECGLRVPRDEIKRKFAEYYGTTVEQIFFS